MPHAASAPGTSRAHTLPCLGPPLPYLAGGVGTGLSNPQAFGQTQAWQGIVNSLTVSSLGPKCVHRGHVLGRPLGPRFGDRPLVPRLESMTFTGREDPRLHGVRTQRGANWGCPGGMRGHSWTRRAMSWPFGKQAGWGGGSRWGRQVRLPRPPPRACRAATPGCGPALGWAQGTNPPVKKQVLRQHLRWFQRMVHKGGRVARLAPAPHSDASRAHPGRGRPRGRNETRPAGCAASTYPSPGPSSPRHRTRPAVTPFPYSGPRLLPNPLRQGPAQEALLSLPTLRPGSKGLNGRLNECVDPALTGASSAFWPRVKTRKEAQEI